MLFSELKLGQMILRNRIVMAPMTRSQSTMTVANELMASHYAARAAAGLIITEGTAPSMNGLVDSGMPGLFEDEHIAGWKLVTEAVHREGGKIAVQLMHCGRAAHSAYQAEGARLLGPSPIANPKKIWIEGEGDVDYPIPTEMSPEDIQEAIEEFSKSAENAVAAGFDAVELHAANGYLIDQFLNTASNQRRDEWGGSIANRNRFAIEVVKSVIARVGANRVGIRISPYGHFNGMAPDFEMEKLYLSLMESLNQHNLLYVHIADRTAMGAIPIDQSIKPKIRKIFKGAVILSGGYTKESANIDLENDLGDLIAFGRPFISNPNLVEKLKTNQVLNPVNYDDY